MQGDFVIQIRPDVDLDKGSLQGRIEHLDSGQSARFRTVEELVAFVIQHAHLKKSESGSQNPESRTLGLP